MAKVGRVPKSKKKTRHSKVAVETSVVAIVEELSRRIADEGAISLSVLKPYKKQTLQIFDALVSAGFEVGAKHVRRPLEDQLVDLLGRMPLITWKQLGDHVAGASTKETQAAATNLVDRGRARLVIHATELTLATSKAAVLDAKTALSLSKTIRALTRALSLAQRKNADVLRADVDEMLTRFVSKVAVKSPSTLSDLATLVDTNRESTGLTSVPKLVRILGGLTARDAVHSALLREARAGKFELRPESGMGRLSAEELSFCIPGPQGSRLSWVRRIQEGS